MQRAILSRLILIALFLAIAGGGAIWLVHEFIRQPPNPSADWVLDSVPPSKPLNGLPPSTTQSSAITILIHGKVTDARTGELIPQFAVRVTSVISRGPRYFNPATAFQGGEYSVAESAGDMPYKWYVRIEAPGHLAAASPPLTASATQDFALQPGDDVQGRVVDQDGRPVAGAAVYLAIADTPAFVSPAHPDTGYRGIQTTSGPDGRFSLPPQTGPYKLMAMNDMGFAQSDSTALAKDSTLHLAAWGGISGTLTLNGKPFAAGGVGWELKGATQFFEYQDYGSTGPDGGFHFDHVPPGEIIIYREVVTNPLGVGYITVPQQVKQFTVPPAGTAQVTLGEGGRAVSGRIVVPKSLNFHGRTIITGFAVAAGTPDTQPTNNSNDFELYWQHRYALEIDGAGRFVINDVPGGNFDIHVHFGTLPATTQFATGTGSFTMPPVSPDLQNQPLEIGDIQIRRAP